jgi:AcrR family transcriptional regulator
MKSAGDEVTTARRYRMTARAEAAAATGERILDAAVEAFWEVPGGVLSLDDIADRAGVSVQTIIRRFGGREGLLAAAGRREAEKVGAERGEAPVGDTPGAVRNLVRHYEDYGDRVLRLLAEEDRSPALREITDGGRALHRDWCRRVFSPALDGLTGVARERRLAQLVAVCDVQTWKLLRREFGLSLRQTELALIELLTPLTEGTQ